MSRQHPPRPRGPALLLAALLAPAAAVAAPTFVSIDPEAVEIASGAWAEAEACTGWTAPAHDEVLVDRTLVDGGFGGRAHLDRDGLYRVEIGLGIRHAREVLVHEIAHAWVHGGPAALTEGRTALLADCIVQRRPDLAPLQWDDGRTLDALPDLLHWSNPQVSHRPDDLDSQRTAAYLGADRLLRTAALVLPPERLWPRSGRLDWAEFIDALQDAGTEGEAVVAVLRGGEEVQREALSDGDRDGLPQIAEHLVGARSDRWDTDGDGWWDGAPDAPRDAVPLPPDGTWVCSGRATGPAGGTVELVSGGNLRGLTRPPPVLSAGLIDLVRGTEEPGTLLAGSSILLRLDTPTRDVSGGTWAAARGAGLFVDAGCRSDTRFTLWAEDRSLQPAVAAVASALDVALQRAEVVSGPAPSRLVVALGGGHTYVDAGVVHVGQRWLEEAHAEGDLEALAALVVAAHREGDPAPWEGAAALAAALLPEGSRTPGRPPDAAIPRTPERDSGAEAGAEGPLRRWPGTRWLYGSEEGR